MTKASLRKGLLSISALWLCGLASLEFARIQLFVPGPFSLLDTSMFGLGFFLAVALLTWPFKTKPILLPILTAWICLAGVPGNPGPIFSSLLLIALATGFRETGSKRGWVWVGATLLPAASLFFFPGSWKFWVPFFLCVLALEMRSLWLKECELLRLEQSPTQRAAKEYRADLLWRGVTELGLACTREYASNFTDQVFRACDEIVCRYGGRRLSRGLQRAEYSFQSLDDLQGCAEPLAAYAQSVNEVLLSASLPTLSHVFLVEASYRDQIQQPNDREVKSERPRRSKALL